MLSSLGEELLDLIFRLPLDGGEGTEFDLFGLLRDGDSGLFGRHVGAEDYGVKDVVKKS